MPKPAHEHPADYPFVVVVWRDALGPFDVETASTHDFAVTRSYTAGWLIKDTTDLVAVAGTWDSEPEATGWRDVSTIPKGMVEDVWRVQNPAIRQEEQ